MQMSPVKRLKHTTGSKKALIRPPWWGSLLLRGKMSSNRANAVRVAFEKGYRVNADGSVSGKRTEKLTLDTSRRYPMFAIRIDGVRMAVPVHKLAAYQKFGEDALRPGVMVRHLDDDQMNNRPENLALGGAVDNAQDVPKRERIRRAKHAASFKKVLTPQQERDLRNDHKYLGLGYRELMVKYRVSRGTVHNVISRG
jgi:hypothetical protein